MVERDRDLLVKIFADIAGNYCLWAEGTSDDPHQEMIIARKFLAQLHLAILDLPDLGCGIDVKEASFGGGKEIYQR